MPSVLWSQVDLAGVNSCFVAREKPCNLFIMEGKSWESAGIPCKKKAQGEKTWIPPEAVMTFIKHGRLRFLCQPLNGLDQCCRSNILVLNACSIYCVFLCLLPHAHSSLLRSQCSFNVRRDVNRKALRDVGREGAGGMSDTARRTQLTLSGLTVLDARSAPWRLSCFY